MSTDPKGKPVSGVAADPAAAVAAFGTQWLEQSGCGTQALLNSPFKGDSDLARTIRGVAPSSTPDEPCSRLSP